jgi:hypothetical protein
VKQALFFYGYLAILARLFAESCFILSLLPFNPSNRSKAPRGRGFLWLIFLFGGFLFESFLN